MELKLIVLAGAKEGTQIPLKKDEFVIGRSSDCTLRAGSGAISRHHCAIARGADGWVVRDMGSRNGTFLNDQQLAAPAPLAVGDELRVGPLKFRVEQYVKKTVDAKPGKPVKEAQPQDINRAKRPPVKDVAEVAERTAAKLSDDTSEENISRWLLGMEANSSEMLRETQTLSMQETTTISRGVAPKKESAPAASPAEDEAGDEVDLEPAEDSAANGDAAAAGTSGWNFFKKGKKATKKKPGKLPPRPAEQSKDSREAAADILREMQRRR